MKIRVYRFVVVLIVIFTAWVARGDLSPESVVVVVNGDSWASLTVADEYVRLRDIPDSHVIVLHDVSSFERVDIDNFRAEILGPVFDAIAVRGLTGQIDCITYSVDLPTSVNVSSDVKGKKLPQVITKVASTNGLTYLHEWVMRKDPDYLRLDINRYSRRVLPLPVGTSLSQEETAEYQRAMALYNDKKFAEAGRIMEGLTRVKRNDQSLYYNLACCQALTSRDDDAMASLRESVRLGWRDYKHLAADSDLVSLHDRSDFKKMVSTMKAEKIEVQATTGFRSSTGWNERGEPSERGVHYMLSTMLGVTSGRGNSVEEVISSLRRAKSADYTKPRGTVYFLKNGNVRSTTREWAFNDAGQQLRALGIRAETDEGVLPLGKSDVMGAMIGTAKFDWKTSKSRIMPGAIVEHLTSCGGMMRERDPQTACTDFIRAGAAGSSGAVTEPYALQAKFPDAFIHLHYARGSTLAEAFYQSVEGPYQLLILGDPMCKPWGEVHRVSISGISRNAMRKGVVRIRARVVGDDIKISEYKLFVDGLSAETIAPGEDFTLDTADYSDGFHRVTVIGVHDNMLATRDRMTLPVRFNNRNRSVRVTSPKKMNAAYGTKIGIDASAIGAKRLEVTHLGEVVGVVDGERGEIAVDSARLGLGVTALRVRGIFESTGDEDIVYGSSVTVEVSPPSVRGKYARSVKSAPGGMLLSIEGAGDKAVTDTYKGNWLADGGVKDGKVFSLTGVFEVDQEGVQQIQMRTNTGARIEIDGVVVAEAVDGNWLYRPVQLRVGSHLLKVSGKAPAGKGRAILDVRMGEMGTRSLSDRWLKQVKR